MKLALTLAGIATSLAFAAPASAAETAPATTTGVGPWEPAPSAPWTQPAGARCDFPVHGEPVVDHVEKRLLATAADGTKVVEYRGALVVRLTDTDTGASYDADASGHAVIEIHPDRSQRWYVAGPVLVGFAADSGTLARGFYTLDGLYTLDIAADGYKSLTLYAGSADALCPRIG
ncbi:hypothetical protein [Yinghuangia seranimata]|uniref:hypothetical protein n=1 Tax=Yinghuangia seranimata TaxID=408067 RepID=UPI00248C1FA4|nr:hypothetical protein [Yinghuangia seranimata]MDI2131649.1 hypothetical protein [Yinghuangia seranimata]